MRKPTLKNGLWPQHHSLATKLKISVAFISGALTGAYWDTVSETSQHALDSIYQFGISPGGSLAINLVSSLATVTATGIAVYALFKGKKQTPPPPASPSPSPVNRGRKNFRVAWHACARLSRVETESRGRQSSGYAPILDQIVLSYRERILSMIDLISKTYIGNTLSRFVPEKINSIRVHEALLRSSRFRVPKLIIIFTFRNVITIDAKNQKMPLGSLSQEKKDSAFGSAIRRDIVQNYERRLEGIFGENQLVAPMGVDNTLRSSTMFETLSSGTDAVTVSSVGSTLTVSAMETLTGGAGTNIVTLGSGGGNTLLASVVETITGGNGTDVVTPSHIDAKASRSMLETLTGSAGSGLETLTGGTGYRRRHAEPHRRHLNLLDA
ncbi:hypothetical protein GBZ48_10420 [Azospirillum melinis]|uniref:Uncharacterized protein n=1 Tax=Azospirillum melinis TaxID=328839 RepID=A0ABX2KIT1_9PROT|nr:hypothetical protein [Azospirillum melinis]MBP2304739.1 hypothetical protein [Azospirillum melinis]NUA99708.1 hypothetical protein [Azospirillum melinis]